MQWMIEHGFEWYETGEAFPNVQEGKNKGLNDFKKSFGGELYPFYKGRIVVDLTKSECELEPSLLSGIAKIDRWYQMMLDMSPRKIGRFSKKLYHRSGVGHDQGSPLLATVLIPFQFPIVNS